MIYEPVSYYPSEGEVGYNSDYALDETALSVLNWINTHDPHSMDYDEEDSVSPIEVEVGSKEEDSYKIITPDMVGFAGGIPINSNKRHTSNNGRREFSDKTDFKNTMLNVYTKILNEKGIDPSFAKSLVAQDALESNWGKSTGGVNNFGGIKGNGTISRTREVINGKDIYINDSFRNFSSLEDYARYKVNLLNNSRYRAFDGSVSDFSRRVASGGYATDPRYRDVLENFIRSIKKGGKIFKGNTGMVFVNESGDKSRSSVDEGFIENATTGVLRNDYYGNGHYDYSNSAFIPRDGHWFSRDPRSGLELKHPDHKTHFMAMEADKAAGYKRYQDKDGRYYTLRDGEQNMPKYLLKGLKEVEFPDYGRHTNSIEESLEGNRQRLRHMWTILREHGASKEQAAAVLGNFYKESWGNYNEERKRNGAYGLAQLLGQRKTAYFNYLKEKGLEDSTDTQIRYLAPIIFGREKNPHNLQGKYKYYINKDNPDHEDLYDSYSIEWNKRQRNDFFRSVGLDDMTESFARNFERPLEKQLDLSTRKKAARYIYNMFKND